MVYPVTNESGVNFNLYNDPEHQNPIDNVYKYGNPAFEKSNEYIQTKKDARYFFIKQNEYIDYQDDPFAIAFIPGEFCFFDHPQSNRFSQCSETLFYHCICMVQYLMSWARIARWQESFSPSYTGVIILMAYPPLGRMELL
jgi:hypothetical protein